jgi:hypothetical protein
MAHMRASKITHGLRTKELIEVQLKLPQLGDVLLLAAGALSPSSTP